MKNTTKKPTNTDPWMLAEEIPDIDFQFSEIWLSCFVNHLESSVGKNYKKILCVYKGLNLKFYFGEKDSDDFAKHILKKLINSPAFGKNMNDNIRKYSDQLKQTAKKITPDFLKKRSNEQLAKFYSDLDELHTTLYTWGWLPNAVDMFHGNFTSYLKDLLGHKLPSDEINQALVSLSTFPEKSAFNYDHESFLKLVALKQSGASKTKLLKALENHRDRFFYFKHLWVGKDGYTIADYEKEVKKFEKSGESAKELLHKEEKIFKQTLTERAKLFRTLKLTKNQRKLFEVYGEFAVTKAYRRDAQLYWAYKMDFVFTELSKRFGISFMETRFLMPEEVLHALTEHEFPNLLKKELKERTTFCAVVGTKGVYTIYYDKEAAAFEKGVEVISHEDVSELSGQTACLGKVKGRVKIVNSPTDMKKMNKGDILVSIATNPDVVPAMKKAAAIVTEQGGITSHAAIVSRELGIPCVIGTKIATKIFKDGDMVEVDANKGIVKKI